MQQKLQYDRRKESFEYKGKGICYSSWLEFFFHNIYREQSKVTSTNNRTLDEYFDKGRLYRTYNHLCNQLNDGAGTLVLKRRKGNWTTMNRPSLDLKTGKAYTELDRHFDNFLLSFSWVGRGTKF